MSIFASCLRSCNIEILVFDCIGRFGLFVKVPCMAVMAILYEMVLGGDYKMFVLILWPFMSYKVHPCAVLFYVWNANGIAGRSSS